MKSYSELPRDAPPYLHLVARAIDDVEAQITKLTYRRDALLEKLAGLRRVVAKVAVCDAKVAVCDAKEEQRGRASARGAR